MGGIKLKRSHVCICIMSKEVCDIQGCNNETEAVIALHASDHYTEVAMCSYHYQDFKSAEDPEITFNMKDNVYSKYKHN
jgi:hypothetical protein